MGEEIIGGSNRKIYTWEKEKNMEGLIPLCNFIFRMEKVTFRNGTQPL